MYVYIIRRSLVGVCEQAGTCVRVACSFLLRRNNCLFARCAFPFSLFTILRENCIFQFPLLFLCRIACTLAIDKMDTGTGCGCCPLCARRRMCACWRKDGSDQTIVLPLHTLRTCLAHQCAVFVGNIHQPKHLLFHTPLNHDLAALCRHRTKQQCSTPLRCLFLSKNHKPKHLFSPLRWFLFAISSRRTQFCFHTQLAA